MQLICRQFECGGDSWQACSWKDGHGTINAGQALDKWPDPPKTLTGDGHAIAILQQFGESRGVRGQDLSILLTLLQRQYLLCIFVPQGAEGFTNFAAVTNRQHRWVFRKHLATIVRWTYCQEEGDSKGILANFNDVLRRPIYPRL